MRPRPVELLRWTRCWLVPAALVAMTPKCVLCLAAYAGIGIALGLGEPELCGAPETTHATPVVLGALGAGGFVLHRAVHRSRSSRS
jgi:hypothetical protein